MFLIGSERIPRRDLAPVDRDHHAIRPEAVEPSMNRWNTAPKMARASLPEGVEFSYGHLPLRAAQAGRIRSNRSQTTTVPGEWSASRTPGRLSCRPGCRVSSHRSVSTM